MMKTFVTRIAIAALALSFATAVQAQTGDWYAAGSIIYADDDPDRAVADAVAGFSLNIGRIMSEHLSLEGSLGYNDWDSWLSPPTAQYRQNVRTLPAGWHWLPWRGPHTG